MAELKYDITDDATYYCAVLDVFKTMECVTAALDGVRKRKDYGGLDDYLGWYKMARAETINRLKVAEGKEYVE
jgi:hypothetical protein